MSQGGQKTAVASWKGASPVNDVVAFYKKAMADQGYKEDSAGIIGDAASLSYTKGNNSVILTVTKQGSDTSISVLFSTK
jgi:hypothetical protein